jgi:hypothetical protein
MIKLSKKEEELLQHDILEYFDYKYCIPKDYRLDNEVYYPVYYSDKRYNHIYGGRGSGKSNEMQGKLPIVLISCLPFCRILIIRQIYNTHRTSTFQEAVDYIERWQLEPFFKVTKQPMQITHLETGNYIIYRGMDNPNSIKSVKDVTHVIWEECFEIKDEEGVSTVDKSVRTPRLKFDIHKHYFVYNPDNKNHWLYDKFHSSKKEHQEQYAAFRRNAMLVKTTYRDNKFVPQSFVDLIEADRTANPERYQVDGLGNFGVLKETGLYYSAFQYNKSAVDKLRNSVYNSDRTIYLTFDFNVYPYISLEIAQLNTDDDNKELQMCHIDEICLTSNEERGKVDKTCIEFLKRYKHHRGRVVICGDRSGNSRKTNAPPDYATVKRILMPTSKRDYIGGGRINPYPTYEELGCKFKLLDKTITSQNPRLKYRQRFFERLHNKKIKILEVSRNNGTINAAGIRRDLSVQYAGYTIVQLIDEDKCPMLLRDYQEVKEDVVKGGKDSRDKELTHTSDAVDYLYCQIFDAEFNKIISEFKR